MSINWYPLPPCANANCGHLITDHPIGQHCVGSTSCLCLGFSYIPTTTIFPNNDVDGRNPSFLPWGAASISISPRAIRPTNQPPGWHGQTGLSTQRMVNSARQMLEENGKKPADIMWVGFHDGSARTTWAELEARSAHVTLQDAPIGMVIVGDGWWLEVRGVVTELESAWHIPKTWVFVTPPVYNPEAKPFVMETSLGK